MQGRKVKVDGTTYTFHQWVIYSNADIRGIIEDNKGLLVLRPLSKIQFLPDTEPTPNETAKEIVEMLDMRISQYIGEDLQNSRLKAMELKRCVNLITDKYLKK